jgi:ribosomal protein S27AE
MTVLAEITELLRRWDVWKRVEAAPERIDALEKKVANLERRLARAPGAECPSCGALEFRTEKTTKAAGPLGAAGVKDRHLNCGKCGYSEVQQETL